MGKITNVAKAWGVGQEQLRQMLAFDKELEDTISENHDLKAKKLSLEAKVEDLQNAVNGLKKQLEEQTAKTARAEKLAAFKGSKSAQPDESVVHKQLDVLEETFISYLASMKDARNRTTAKVADAIRQIHPDAEMTELKAEVYLTRLAKQDYVGLVLNMEGPSYWSLHMRGKEYAVLHKLEFGR